MLAIRLNFSTLMELFQKMQTVFSNREIATFFWIIIAIILLQFNNPFRKSTKGVLRAFLKWKIISMILFAVLYSNGIMYFLSYIEFWDTSMLKDSIFWLILSAFVVLFNINNASKDRNYFRDIVFDNFKIVVAFEFVVNIHDFGLTFEFIFIPIMVSLALILALSETKEETKILSKVIGGMFSVFGLIVIILSIIDIVKSINVYATFDTLKSFLLPIILTIAFIPCAYLIALIMNYESLFSRIGYYLTDKKVRRYAKRRTLLKCHFRLRKINILSPKINEFYNQSTKSEVKRIIN